jgi:alpha-L-rhamnosidase
VSEIVSVKDDVVVMDFGQNMVGVPKLSIPGIAGQQIKIRYAEALHKGQFYTDNYRSAKSTNYIMPSQTGMVDYQPTFTYHGYRYIEISGFDTQHTPQTSWATALIQHSDVDINANFTSSHAKLNKLSENIVWGMRSNFYDIPLDCPQRDERLGWTGDAQVFVTPSMYMADVYGFWSAWLQSVREEQGPDGKIPLYIPFVEWINFASSGWGDAVTIIPWELYTVTGDEQILADNYEMMKGWVNYHQKKSKNNISTMTTFGDWLQPFPIDEENRKDSNRGDTDFSLIGTAYFARSIELTINAANVLGQDDDVKTLSALRDQVINAFRTRFFDEELNLLNARPTQTTYLLGLAYDLFPENKRAIAIDKLIALLDHADMHLRTGFLGTPLLTQVLQDAGRSDVMNCSLKKLIRLGSIQSITVRRPHGNVGTVTRLKMALTLKE